MNKKKKYCQLPGCNREARVRFCSNKHKDRYHNMTNPRGRFAHLNTNNEDYEPNYGSCHGQDDGD